MPAPTESLQAAARAIRAACPTCRTLPRGGIPCENCIRAVCRMLAARWEKAQASATKAREPA